MNKITQISIGRFHHFHLARQLEKYNLLEAIWTGYPSFKLKDEDGIAVDKIKTFPWFRAPYMALGPWIDYLPALKKQWDWLAFESIDYFVAQNIKSPTTLISLSGTGLYSGKKAKSLGGNFICDRGSSHIVFQDNILKDEYHRWGFKYEGVDNRIIQKELNEYEIADFITVPSQFVKNTFISMGVNEEKVIKIPYGARLERFKKIGNPPSNKFRVLWVGAVSIRKGFIDLLNAFNLLSHPNKELLVIGSVQPEIKQIIKSKNIKNVIFKGNLPNTSLAEYYSKSHVFVLPSIEEGLAIVQGEALSCGCPVISTPNSGAEDLFEDGIEGFIVPIRSSQTIHDKLQFLIDNDLMRKKMSENAILRVKKIEGWDTYGKNMVGFLKSKTYELK
ncbi:glycosyltransferase involved in cell wall biosynthesis [Runella defluvii]|uniref:Glycosyltransferase involved in cell wall biosynthesis n=1 Tax=Runella defluvii TaxID=370973 RepID=A0A7W6ENK1_9BACT|nr:glycosyltransferase family 4 protein [Runella defluvii]MBB3836416.1 glycosyltransferase involved in cell wall biosynthesis [Runella defluvii]